MAFVVDDAGDFVSKTNKEMVELTRIVSDETEPFRVFLKAQIERHLALTGSARARALLATSTPPWRASGWSSRSGFRLKIWSRIFRPDT